MASALLGDDGRGYELARKLENHGVWRTWLDDSAYSSFVHFLSSPSTWDAFMRADDSKSRAQIQLHLRARAFLFDKAFVSLLQQSNRTPNVVVSKLNPASLDRKPDSQGLKNATSQQLKRSITFQGLETVQIYTKWLPIIQGKTGDFYYDEKIDQISKPFPVPQYRKKLSVNLYLYAHQKLSGENESGTE